MLPFLEPLFIRVCTKDPHQKRIVLFDRNILRSQERIQYLCGSNFQKFEYFGYFFFQTLAITGFLSEEMVIKRRYDADLGKLHFFQIGLERSTGKASAVIDQISVKSSKAIRPIGLENGRRGRNFERWKTDIRLLLIRVLLSPDFDECSAISRAICPV